METLCLTPQSVDIINNPNRDARPNTQPHLTSRKE